MYKYGVIWAFLNTDTAVGAFLGVNDVSAVPFLYGIHWAYLGADTALITKKRFVTSWSGEVSFYPDSSLFRVVGILVLKGTD